MKKLYVLSIVLGQALWCNAQVQFEEVSDTPFEGVSESSIAFADVDGDGDQDVLITGRDKYNNLVSQLYINDGQGDFTEKPETPFEEVSNGAIAFADIDGDGDQDVLITGADEVDESFTGLYTNDGEGNFTEVKDTPFEDVQFSSIAFADVDGDGSQDVLITGIDKSFEPFAQLYMNDGEGDFTEAKQAPFEGVAFGAVAFADVNDNGSKDIFISGVDITQVPTARLYMNDGKGNFKEEEKTPFEGVLMGSAAFADINGNGNQDVLVTGTNTSEKPTTTLYTNDGKGVFSKVPDTPFEGISLSSIAFADVDGGGSKDLLITGETQDIENPKPVAKLYINDGKGNFKEEGEVPFKGVNNSSIAFADVNGNGDQEVLITGSLGSIKVIAKLYSKR